MEIMKIIYIHYKRVIDTMNCSTHLNEQTFIASVNGFIDWKGYTFHSYNFRYYHVPVSFSEVTKDTVSWPMMIDIGNWSVNLI